jgi:hypothetical protein
MRVPPVLIAWKGCSCAFAPIRASRRNRGASSIFDPAPCCISTKTPAGLFADLRTQADWERYAVNTPVEQAALLDGIAAFLAKS